MEMFAGTEISVCRAQRSRWSCLFFCLLWALAEAEPEISALHMQLSPTMTYDSAQQKCTALGMRLCYAHELCWGLEFRLDLLKSRDVLSGDHWVPLQDASNEWLQVGDYLNRTCCSHNGPLLPGSRCSGSYSPPEWGNSGTPSSHKGHVYCCQTPQEPLLETKEMLVQVLETKEMQALRAQKLAIGKKDVLCPDLWKCVGQYYLRREVQLPVYRSAIDNSWLTANDTDIWLVPRSEPVETRVSKYNAKNFHYAIKERFDRAVFPRTTHWRDYLRLTQYDDTEGQQVFSTVAVPILKEHFEQTLKDARTRRQRYQNTVLFGEIDPLELLLRLSHVADRTDPKVGLVSQWMHTLQVWQAMKLDGITDREFLFTGIIHDIGKLLSLVEQDAYADGCSRGLNYHKLEDGAGLEQLTILFDHHDFGADKMRKYVSPRVYRLMRYHCFKDMNIEYAELLRVATEEERQQIPEIKRFFSYDQLSKSMWVMPNVRMSEIKQIVRAFLPPTIIF